MPDEGIGISAHTGTSSTAAKAVETYSGSTPYAKFYCAGIEKLFLVYLGARASHLLYLIDTRFFRKYGPCLNFNIVSN